VEVAQGDLLNIDSLRTAFTGVSTLFLLNAVASDEFTQAIITLNVARETGVERVVYLSVIHADRFVNVPHFAVKSGAERMIQQMGFSATILRPSYFIDNEHMIKDVIFNYGVYTMPIGSKGVAMVDARLAGDVQGDERLGEFVARHCIEQEQCADAAERSAQLLDIEQIAFHDRHAGRKLGLRGIAGQHADVGAARDELLDDVAADTAGGAGHEDGHGGHS